MATRVYRSGYFYLIDGTPVYATPLKIKYLRDFMDKFEDLKKSQSESETIDILIQCADIALRQYYPSISGFDAVEENLDIQTLYDILEFAAGIKMKGEEEQRASSKAKEEGSDWEDLDLASLEAELFLLGIWKDYEELESSLSMPELTATLNAKRELQYSDKKFFAAIQGVDLDKNSGNQNAWEEMKARVFSKGRAADPNDITALQGYNAEKAGFGIGMGLDYQRID